MRGRREAVLRCQVVQTLEGTARWGTPSSSLPAPEPAPMQYIALFAATAMASTRDPQHACHLRRPLKHAASPRNFTCSAAHQAAKSPGDVFYLHSRLLEQLRVSDNLGGAPTARHHRDSRRRLREHPDQRHSITDGQIFSKLTSSTGASSAVNVGLSVSRVGFSAPVKATKQVGATRKLDPRSTVNSPPSRSSV